MKTFLLIITVALCLTLLLFGGTVRETPRTEYMSVQGFTALRGEVATLQQRVKQLEAVIGTDKPCIKEYTIDSVAGTIKCRSCQFTDEEKK